MTKPRKGNETPYVPKVGPDVIAEVPHADDMDDETFIKHLEKRHAKDCKVEDYISRHAVDAWIKTYRAFHARLHAIEVPGQYDHEHEGEF